MWPNLILKAKEGGLDVIQTYVFWNLHEPRQGQVNSFMHKSNFSSCFIIYFIFELITYNRSACNTLLIGSYFNGTH